MRHANKKGEGLYKRKDGCNGGDNKNKGEREGQKGGEKGVKGCQGDMCKGEREGTDTEGKILQSWC